MNYSWMVLKVGVRGGHGCLCSGERQAVALSLSGLASSLMVDVALLAVTENYSPLKHCCCCFRPILD